ncbi:hypothetical protein BDR04DRAFT_1125658 [Suillus decipiens]|nr:hypothetical protein BDR04DRAFT_1125658 [Suillus decipiens]
MLPLTTTFIINTDVDEVGHHIQSLHKCAPKKHTSAVSDEVIDQCEHSYEAINGKKQKAVMDSFDDTGVMVLICQHDISLFFANIDSPGKQQKYAIALLEHLFSLVPQEANVIALYDVSCVLSWSLSHILQTHTEVWWLIDRQAAAIGMEMQVDLGDWIKRHLKHGVNNQGSAEKKALRKCGITAEDLQAQWEDQKKSQLSIRAYAPTQLKKELDMVLALQADLDASDRALQATHSVVKKGSVSEETLHAIASLEHSHKHLMTKVEVLYLSLNVHDRFPELQDLDLDFVRTLLMACCKDYNLASMIANYHLG